MVKLQKDYDSSLLRKVVKNIQEMLICQTTNIHIINSMENDLKKYLQNFKSN